MAPISTRVAARPGLRRSRQRQPRRTRARRGTRCSWRRKGARVGLVSGGDPGVFAMAAAVLEAIEQGPPAWRALDIAGLPGISAMQAAAARLGAPLGGDFCAISLSDNLKPWALIERRLSAASDGDFVLALYNPASQRAAASRSTRRSDCCARIAQPATPVAFARAVGRADERDHADEPRATPIPRSPT